MADFASKYGFVLADSDSDDDADTGNANAFAASGGQTMDQSQAK